MNELSLRRGDMLIEIAFEGTKGFARCIPKEWLDGSSDPAKLAGLSVEHLVREMLDSIEAGKKVVHG